MFVCIVSPQVTAQWQDGVSSLTDLAWRWRPSPSARSSPGARWRTTSSSRVSSVNSSGRHSLSCCRFFKRSHIRVWGAHGLHKELNQEICQLNQENISNNFFNQMSVFDRPPQVLLLRGPVPQEQLDQRHGLQLPVGGAPHLALQHIQIRLELWDEIWDYNFCLIETESL